ncbi:MAG: c-type cytochrome [Calditrichae bacterium]|nr:c-type cytochrome [Calditrichia bacterium]NIV71865.1 c-type cytochrome [Calditrichia bacterium]NIW78717.1 c-type cytochrome [Calditrichia bacterium]
MKNALMITVFTLLVTLFYWYVGQQVPQKETHPPEKTEIASDLTTDEMMEIGKEIVGGKGTCLTCHTIGSKAQATRFPDLANIGARAETRKKGMSAVEYLAESLYEPNAYIVEGYQAGMPTIHKPPINLSDEEILTVIAYLQSLGSTPTVTMETNLKWAQETPSAEKKGAAATAQKTPAAGTGGTNEAESLSGKALFTEHGCNTCHLADAPTKLVGPSLYDVGNRLSKAEIYESILNPDARVTEGFSKGVMKAFLAANSFYDQVSSNELKKLVDYLASLKGN